MIYEIGTLLTLEKRGA